MFGKFGRAMVRPIFYRATAADAQPQLNQTLRACLRWWIALLARGDEHSFRRCIAIGDRRRETFILYTDASPEALGAVLIRPDGTRSWLSVPLGPGDRDTDI